MKATPEQIQKLKDAAKAAGTGEGNLQAVLRAALNLADTTSAFDRVTAEQADRLITMFEAKRITDAAHDAVDSELAKRLPLNNVRHLGTVGDREHYALAEGNKLNISIRRKN